METRQVTIRNKTGLHLRPAALFAGMAGRFKSSIVVESGGRSADGRSALSLMLLELAPGRPVTIRAEGEDEREAAQALAALVESGFAE